MAIDPKLVSIIPASQLPTGDPTNAADFLFYEGDALKKGSMSNIYDKVTSGIKGVATQTNAPTAYTPETYPDGLTEIWRVFDPLTSPNSWGNIAVTQSELNANDIYFVVTNGVVAKKTSPKTIADPAKIVTWTATTFASGVQVIYNGVLYQSNVATVAGDVPGVSAKWDVKLSAGSDTASPNVNLYDSTKDVVGFLANDGTPGVNATARYSAFIPINDAMYDVDLILSARSAAISAVPKLFIYDKNKALLGNILLSEFANIFRITNRAVRFVRFNTVWVDGVVNADLKLYKVAEVLDVPNLSNKGFENATDTTLINSPIISKNALITDIGNIAYVDITTASEIVELLFVNVADNATETIKIDINKTGFQRIPKELIKTTFTNFYLGVRNGVTFSNKSTHNSATLVGSILTDSNFNVGYSVGYLKPNLPSFKTAVMQSYKGTVTGEFTLNETITIPAGKKIIGDKCKVTLGSSAKIILGFGASLSFVDFIGNRAHNDNYINPTITKADLPNYETHVNPTDRFIEVGNKAKVHNCDFLNINKLAVYISGASGEAGSAYSNSFSNCHAAIYAPKGYCQVYDNDIFNPVWGIIITAGNVYLNNNKIYFGSVGYVLHDIYNGSHGSIIGGSANHLPIASLYIKNCVTSQILSGVCMFDGDIIADYCEGLNISGCLLDNQIRIANGKTNLITGTVFRNNYKPAGAYFVDTNNTLVLKSNVIQGATNHAAVNN